MRLQQKRALSPRAADAAAGAAAAILLLLTLPVTPLHCRSRSEYHQVHGGSPSTGPLVCLRMAAASKLPAVHARQLAGERPRLLPARRQWAQWGGVHGRDAAVRGGTVLGVDDDHIRGLW